MWIYQCILLYNGVWAYTKIWYTSTTIVDSWDLVYTKICPQDLAAAIACLGRVFSISILKISHWYD